MAAKRFAGLLGVLLLSGCGTTVPQVTTVVGAAYPTNQPGTTAQASPDGRGPIPSTATPGATDGSPGPAAGAAATGGGTAGPRQIAAAKTAAAATVIGSRSSARTTARTTSGGGGRKGPSTPGPSGTAGSAKGQGGGVASSPTVSAPIKIGITVADTSEADTASGLTNSSTVTQYSTVKAQVTALNAKGGLDGRMIAPDYYTLQATDNDYGSDASTACAQFTQDNHDDLVIDTTFGPLYGFESCIQQAGVATLSTIPGGDATQLAPLTLQASPFVMDLDRQYSATITGLVNSGYLTKADKVGVIKDSCAATGAAYDNTIAPLMKRLGLTVETPESVDCPAGYGTLGPAAQEVSAAELAFNTDGVDRVLAISSDEQIVVILFSQAADTQKYHPGYLLSAGAHAAAIRGDMPSGQWPQMHGAGYDPTLDVDAAPGPFTATESRCLALTASGGVSPATYTDDFYIFQSCGAFLLAEAALKADGGVSTGRVLISAVHGLGASFASPGVIGDSTDFSGARSDGPNALRLFNFVASCTCMTYTGAQFTQP